MSEEQPDLSPLDLGDGRAALFDEPTSGFYRVRMPSGEVQAFPSGSAATRENAMAALVTEPLPPIPAQDQAGIYAEHLAAGYEDTTTGRKLKTTERARSIFTSQTTMIQVALAAGVINGATPQTFFDYDDVEQTLSTDDFLGLMLRFGAHWKAMFDAYAP